MENKIWDIIAKDVAGEATVEEKKYLEELALTDTETADILKDAEKHWTAAEASNPKFDAERGWDTFLENTGQTAKVRSIHIKKGPSFNNNFLFKVAAAVVIIFTTSLIGYNLFFNTSSTIVATTAANETKVITLPDGSVVTLNESSTLEYPKSFTGGERAVALTGEAFFEVSKDPENPFKIKTENSLTTVLGTSFNIRAYENVPVTEIAVVTGKVSFKSVEEDKEVILTAGNSALLNANKELIKVESGSKNALSWKNNKLIFNETSIEEVIHDLEHHFNITIKAENEAINNCRFTGTFDDPTLDGVLQSLQFTHNIQFEENQKDVILRGAGCQ